MIKKIFHIFFWVALVTAWFIPSSFISGKYQKIKIKNISIKIIDDNHHDFITKSEINSLLSSIGIVKNVSLKEEIYFSTIESRLCSHPAVNSAEVYFNNNGDLELEINKRTPIARFVSQVPEKNFYIDESGFLINGSTPEKIKFIVGDTYHFDLSDSSNANNPIKLSQTIDGIHNEGSEYTTSVTTNGTAGSSGAYLKIEVDNTTPKRLYYYSIPSSSLSR